MVVMLRLATSPTAMLQERIAAPSTWTVQHPHRPATQPKRVPVNPSSSRRTHKSGVWGALSTVRRAPLTMISIMYVLAMNASPRRGHGCRSGPSEAGQEPQTGSS
jgi:hypothetical protein